MTLTEWITENTRTLAIIGLAYIAYVEFTDATYPSVPDGSQTAILGVLAVSIAGYGAASKIYDLLPDEEGIYLVAFRASDDTGGAVWELSEDQFEDLEVVAGSLFQWPVSKRVYECREYRPEENVAVGNWRESVAGSQLAGGSQVVTALEEIRELREVFEPESQKFRILKRRLRGIARTMDRRRAEDQQKILDENLTPGFDSESPTVSEIINDELPEELRPDSMDSEEIGSEPEEPEEFAGFDLLDDGDAIDPEPMENHE